MVAPHRTGAELKSIRKMLYKYFLVFISDESALRDWIRKDTDTRICKVLYWF